MLPLFSKKIKEKQKQQSTFDNQPSRKTKNNNNQMVDVTLAKERHKKIKQLSMVNAPSFWMPVVVAG